MTLHVGDGDVGVMRYVRVPATPACDKDEENGNKFLQELEKRERNDKDLQLLMLHIN